MFVLGGYNVSRVGLGFRTAMGAALGGLHRVAEEQQDAKGGD